MTHRPRIHFVLLLRSPSCTPGTPAFVSRPVVHCFFSRPVLTVAQISKGRSHRNRPFFPTKGNLLAIVIVRGRGPHLSVKSDSWEEFWQRTVFTRCDLAMSLVVRFWSAKMEGGLFKVGLKRTNVTNNVTFLKML